MFGSYVADPDQCWSICQKRRKPCLATSLKLDRAERGEPGGCGASRQGADITIVTKIGRDVFGQLATDFYRKENINTEYVLVDEGKGNRGCSHLRGPADRTRTRYWSFREPANFTQSDIDKIRVVLQDADILLAQSRGQYGRRACTGDWDCRKRRRDGDLKSGSRTEISLETLQR